MQVDLTRDQPRIRQVVFRVEHDRNYKFDVNHTITIRSLRKMVVAAANVCKSVRIFHKKVEYTDKQESTLNELFPDLQIVEFDIRIIEGEANKYNDSSIKLRFGDYCPKHDFKYPYFFCYDCKTSICSICLQSGDHKLHNYIEKYDYLQNSRNLVESIFRDVHLNLPDFDFDNVNEIKTKLKMKSFPLLKDLLNTVELRISEVLDHFCETERVSYSCMQQNIGLLKKNCAEGLEELKNEISFRDMMANEEIFLEFDRKLKQIANEKLKITADNLKYDELRKLLTSISLFSSNIISEIYTFLIKYTEEKQYDDFKRNIRENSVTLVRKEDIWTNLGLYELKKNGFFSAKKLDSSQKKNFWKSEILKEKSDVKEDFKSSNTLITATETINATPFPSSSNLITRLEHSLNDINAVSSNKSLHTISNVVPRSKDIIIYENDNNSVARLTVEFSPLLGVSTFLPKCSILNHENKIYISGGVTNTEPSASFLVYDNLTGLLSRLTDMPIPRHSHSMIHYNGYIYFVGGSSKTTERFDLKELKFVRLNELNCEIRFNPTLYVHSNFLYAFFGSNSRGEYLDSIEKLNLKSPKSRWEVVPYKNSKNCDLKMSGCGLVIGEDKSIYFFGGKGKDGLKSSIYRFDFKSYSWEKVEASLEEPISFPESLLADLGGNTYGHFNFEKAENFFKIQLH